MNSPSSVVPNLADWPILLLRDVTTILRRGTAPVYADASDVRAIGQRCITNTDFASGYARPHSSRAMTNVLVPQQDDVLVNSTGTGTIGRSVIFRERTGQYIVDGHVTVARPSPAVIAPRWLNDILRSPWGQRYLESRCYAGSTNQIELSSGALADFPLATPSLPEQRRIAEILDTLDDQIRATERIIAKLGLAKQGTAHNLLDEQPWFEVPLAEVSEVRNGTTPSRARRDYWDGGTVPWLASGKVNEYVVKHASELVTTRAVSDCGLRILPPGSIIIGMIGEGKTRGMSARLDLSAAINQNLAGVIPGKDLDGGFLHHYLVHSYQRLRGGGRGSNQDALNTKLVSDFLVPLPPLERQHNIARTLDALDRRASEEALAIAKLRLLKEGLMSDLLTGRIRVPMETAS